MLIIAVLLFLGDSESEPQQPFTTNILINIKNSMLKSLWNSKFGGLFHGPIDDEVYTAYVILVTCWWHWISTSS